MSDKDLCWDLMEEIKTCMLVTVTDDGPRARPMSAILRSEENEIWFLTDSGSHKTEDMEKQPDVCLTFSDGASRHISVLGHATLTSDRAVIRDLWSPAAKAFWPDGPEDSAVEAIHVQPTSAEIWDGDNRAVAAVKAVFAMAKGQRVEPGRNVKVKL